MPYAVAFSALALLASSAQPPADVKRQPAPPAPLPEIVIVNAGFEGAPVEEQIPGWTKSQHAGEPSYEMAIDPKNPFKGKASFRMTRTLKQIYGSLGQYVTLPATAVGKKIQLAAALKSENVGPRGWVAALTFQNNDGIIGQQRSKPMVGTNRWTTVKIDTVVPVGTQKIEVAVLLLDEGSGWVDDLHLRLVD